MKSLPGILLKSLSVATGAVMLALPAWSAKTRGASNYGVDPLSECSPATSGPFSGVSATCYNGGFTAGYLYNFTLASPSAATTVTSFTIDFGDTTPSEVGLVVGGGTPLSCGGVVPCSLTDPPPFDVTGTLGTGSQTFDFSGFTGNLSGQVTVYFDDESLVAPSVTDITTSANGATPEPGTFAMLSGAMALFLTPLIWRRRAVNVK